MKKHLLKKKLVLDLQQIRSLDDESLRAVVGGLPSHAERCSGSCNGCETLVQRTCQL